MAEISAEHLRDTFGDLAFPAGKEALVQHAEQRGSEPVVRTVRALPVETYRSVDEVVRAVDTVEATGQGRSEEAAQARERASTGLAEHERRTRT